MRSCLPSYMYMCISVMSRNVLYCMYGLFRVFVHLKFFTSPSFGFGFVRLSTNSQEVISES